MDIVSSFGVFKFVGFVVSVFFFLLVFREIIFFVVLRFYFFSKAGFYRYGRLIEGV